MKERKISEELVLSIVRHPQQSFAQGETKMIYQSIVEEQQAYLIRVFVNIIKMPNLVITVYKISKVEKYWKDED